MMGLLFFHILQSIVVLSRAQPSNAQCSNGTDCDASFGEDGSINMLQLRANSTRTNDNDHADFLQIGPGGGCCSGPRDVEHGKLWAGSLPDFAACKEKCREFQKCAIIEYGWKDNKQWCFIWTRKQQCRVLEKGPGKCGPGGGSEGVHAYRFMNKRIISRREEAVVPAQESGQITNLSIGEPPSLFIATFSRRAGFASRSAVRRNWLTLWPGATARFVICDTPVPSEGANLQVKLKSEADVYGDLLFLNCKEGYQELNIKAKRAMEIYFDEWSDTHSAYMKNDDDSFVSWTRLRSYLAVKWTPSTYAGVPYVQRDKGTVIRDPCCVWSTPYKEFPEAKFPKSYPGGPGYFLSKDLVSKILSDVIPNRTKADTTVTAEDRQVAVWVGQAALRGFKVDFLNIPGVNGYSSTDLREHCSSFDIQSGIIIDYINAEFRSGLWSSRPHIVSHKLDPWTITCLTRLDTDDSLDELSTCFPPDRADSEKKKKGHFEQAPTGCECNLCGDGSQDWVFVLSAGGRTGSTTIQAMLNSIPGFYVAGENDGMMEEMMHIHEKVFEHDSKASEHKLLCTLQATVKAAIGGDTDKYDKIGFKEIRITNRNTLDFMVKLFPCARFIVSVRNDIEAQLVSQHEAFNWRHKKVEDVGQYSSLLKAWAHEHRTVAYVMHMEEFSTRTFNNLLRFLNVGNCNFPSMLHEDPYKNATHKGKQVPVQGNCLIDGKGRRSAAVMKETNKQRAIKKHDDYSQYEMLRFIPSRNVVLCACVQCGRSSMYSFVYSSMFGKAWGDTGESAPAEFISQASDERWKAADERWHGELKRVNSSLAESLTKDEDAFKFALIRDPLERVLAGFNAKISCCNWDQKSEEEQQEDSQMVQEILAIASDSSRRKCLTFPEFQSYMGMIINGGRAKELPPIFVPQQYYCFDKVPLSKWSMVAQVSDPNAAKILGIQLGNTKAKSFPHVHVSSPRVECESPTQVGVVQLLQNLYPEYQALQLTPPTVFKEPWLYAGNDINEVAK